MSKLSDLGKKLGIREWRLDREGRAAAQALVRQQLDKALADFLKKLGKKQQP